MASSVASLLALVLLTADASAAAISRPLEQDLVARTIPQLLSGYDPVKASCPATPLIRPATSASSLEAAYVSSRQQKANAGLAAWLKKIDSSFDTCKLPQVALTSSGGGYRALLNGAGVIQGLDARDSNVATSGLYQGLTYQAGLSGGAWLLSSVAGNDWPTISSLKTSLWEEAFQDSVLLPGNALAPLNAVSVVNDISAKADAGYDTNIVDPYGRLLSFQLLKGYDGGVATTLSSLASKSNFTSFNVPYPVITALGVNTFAGQCSPQLNATQYEFTPYEFGSWDNGVKAFVQSAYLGSRLKNGQPVQSGVCTKNYDNLGYVLGTSSNVFAALCFTPTPSNNTDNLSQALEELLSDVHLPENNDIYATYPNPFAGSSGSPLVSSQSELNLADGGLALQNNPIWPFIQPERNVSVLIVNDNSADTTDNFPNGTEIYTTYQQASADGLTKMPTIPPVSTFVEQGLNKRATFFGCNSSETLTIVYLPNVAYTYASGTSTGQLVYSKADTDGIIGNGVAIANQNGTAGWAECLACAVQKKTGTTLPASCQSCFANYCYN